MLLLTPLLFNLKCKSSRYKPPFLSKVEMRERIGRTEIQEDSILRLRLSDQTQTQKFSESDP